MDAHKWSQAARRLALTTGMLLVAAGASACIGDLVNDPGANPVPAVVLIKPSASGPLTAIGAQRSFTAEVRDAGGAVLGSSVTWTSDNSLVATVDPSTGVATVVGNGTTVIRATVAGIVATESLTVMQVVATIAITPASFSLALFDSRDLLATAWDANDHLVARPVQISWQSSDAGSVSVTARAADGSAASATRNFLGDAVITASAEGVSGTTTVH